MSSNHFLLPSDFIRFVSALTVTAADNAFAASITSFSLLDAATGEALAGFDVIAPNAVLDLA